MAGKEGGEGSREREAEKNIELWAHLDELEREEEEYLAKERERELAAANKQKGMAEGEDKPTTRTRFSDASEEKKHVTVKVKEGPHKLAVASGPLRIIVKHTPSQDTAAPIKAKMVCPIQS